MKRFLKYLCMVLIRKSLGRLGKNSYINPLGTYLYPKKIFIGDNVFINKRAMISASEGITIGNGVTIGPEFMVMGGDHNFRKVGKAIYLTKSGGVNKSIIIEADTWIGARVLILKGVTIGEGAIIGAGSVVTKNVPPYTIYAGNPAQKIGLRFSREELTKHLQLVNSKYRFDELCDIF